MRELLQELVQWMTEHDYQAVSELQGTMSQIYCPNPSEFERAQYMKAIQTYHPAPVTSSELR